MKTLFETDIINSATPLEVRYAGLHPRLYATEERIVAIRQRLSGEPWAGFLRRVEALAARVARFGADLPRGNHDVRGLGCGLAHLAVAYRLTGKPHYLAAARDLMATLAQEQDWGHALQYGHWAHGMAVAYDWLFHDLEESVRHAARQALTQATERVVARWVSYSDAMPTSYAWNHMAVVHGGLMPAGCALWGEVAGAGRWLRLGLEKMHLMVESLGPDGASAEGLAYGQYHLDFLLKSMMLTDQLLGVDLFEESSFLRSYPLFMLYNTLPRCAWVPGPPEQSYLGRAFVCLGDSEGAHWYGPDWQLRLLAARYGDGRAQWLAEAAAEGGINGESSCFLNLLVHNATVQAVPPDDLPSKRHFTDKDLVALRSGWDDRASVMALKCGPSAGYHARRHYRQNVSGGHMHPDAGHIVLHACGDWLLIDDGYARKSTAYQNTVLVNGIGQTGEGGDWFEDLEMRRGKAEGRIVAARFGSCIDWTIADAAPAYRPEARLVRFIRHVVYIRPDVWVVVDDLAAEVPSTFEIRLHTPHGCRPVGAGAWAMCAEQGALHIWTLGPAGGLGRPFRDPIEGVSARVGRELDGLAVANATPQAEALFVTVLHAHMKDRAPRIQATGEQVEGIYWLSVSGGNGTARLGIRPGQADPTLTIIGIDGCT